MVVRLPCRVQVPCMLSHSADRGMTSLSLEESECVGGYIIHVDREYIDYIICGRA